MASSLVKAVKAFSKGQYRTIKILYALSQGTVQLPPKTERSAQHVGLSVAWIWA